MQKRASSILAAIFAAISSAVAEPSVYERDIQPVLKEYCFTCHSTKKQKGDLDLERFTSMELARRDPSVWEHALEQFANQEMPPKGKPQPTPAQMERLTAWMQDTLEGVARETAGDPGPVALRRLSNMEYTYTVRDLTGVESLDPTKEFPADGAAGEGFTNASAALGMSPALLTKYFDAAKKIAAHAILLPDGIRFSEHTTSRDWTDDILAKIREFYARYTETAKGTEVNAQGFKFETSTGGRLPLEKYLAALMHKTGDDGLNAKYLAMLRAAFADTTSSLLLDGLRAKFRSGTLTAGDIEAWQQSLWRFSNVGLIGRENGPKAWQEAVTPLAASAEVHVKLTVPKDGGDVTLYLATSEAGDGNDGDFALWENPRLVVPGRADLALRDVRTVLHRLKERRDALTASVASCLAAAHEAVMSESRERTDVAKLAQKHGVDAQILVGWLDYLGISSAGEVKLEPLISKKLESVPNYNFIKGWTGEQALSVLANSSDETREIPGTMKAHSVATHPSPTLASVIAWRSPVAGSVRIHGDVQDAHIACGNGITWALELRRGHTREVLASGVSEGAKLTPLGPFESVRVQPGDVIAVVIGPRDGNHSCDLTTVNLTLSDGKTEWDLAKDVSSDILAGNPHADRHGHQGVWHFLSEAAKPDAAPAIPDGSLLALWRRSNDADERKRLAKRVQQLLERGAASRAANSPDRALHDQLMSYSGPLLAPLLRSPAQGGPDGSASPFGVDPALFGRHPDGGEVGATSLCVKAPSVIEVRLPASLAEGAEFVVTGRLHAPTGAEGSVQMQVLTSRPASLSQLVPCKAEATAVKGQWSDNNERTQLSTPVIVNDRNITRRRFVAAFDDFRTLFPAALCYTKIVPVDEVVTLTLFHREDAPLKRLMLDEAQASEIDRLWEELRFVGEVPLKQVDVFEQLYQFSTQDAKPSAFEPLRAPILRGAETFKNDQREAEPRQVQAVLDFAERAWRRPLKDSEVSKLRGLYATLRKQELPHEAALRMTLARTLVAPAFLYRGESAVPGPDAAPVSDGELATRLSYFLWSSTPDDELRSLAGSGKLHEPTVLAAQAQRMMKDARVRRLAAEFGCQWLQVRDVETLDEKSERHFPTFAALRGAMQEEVVRFFMDVFQEDRSVLSLLDADYTFVNGALAAHYGIDVARHAEVEPGGASARTDIGMSGYNWRRIDGMRAKGRGGILGFAATLAKQSGASRTSPILRGNWLSEVVLGEKLPRPPKGVPILADEAPEGLTERQLIEKHSSDATCARCHQRIDPFGFALEGYDAIGRARTADTRATLSDGTTLEGLEGLRSYLLGRRRDDFLNQFCRKLLGYALGRSVQLSDKPVLETMLARLKADDYSVGAAIELIVGSEQFRKVRGRDFIASH
jgi:hypothetical protein